VSGFSPVVTESTNTPMEYRLQVTNENGSYITPNLRAVPVMYSANLSSSGSTLNIPVGNMTVRYNGLGNGNVSEQIMANSGTVTADVKKIAQYDTTAVDSSAMDDATFTATPTAVDTTIYGHSNEYHVTRIRQQDPATGLWSLYDVHLFASNGSTRVNAWVEQKAEGMSFS
jgi:hypothetical protein